MAKTKRKVWTKDSFIEKSRETHGALYDYSKGTYTKTESKFLIICKDHGEFMQTPKEHMKGQGCPKCGIESRVQKSRLTLPVMLSRFSDAHSDEYGYSKVTAVNSIKKDKVTIICKDHGEFMQAPAQHILGQGCPACGKKKIGRTQQITQQEFIDKGIKTHNGFYSYGNAVYDGYHKSVTITCPEHGDFTPLALNHLKGHGCPKCANTGPSKPETDVYDFIKANCNHNIIQSDRSLLDGMEVDIYIPKLKLAIEFNGTYWHDSRTKDKNYHSDKSNTLREKGIHLIHIFGDHWVNKRPICESIILAALGKQQHIYNAREFTVSEISKEEAKLFNQSNHIYEHRNAEVNLGLIKDGKIYSVMTFGHSTFNKNYSWELIRFANELYTSINGGAAKLFNHFVKEYNPYNILCFADASLFNGRIYEKLGFTNLGITKPNNWYFHKGYREHRSNYMKHKLDKQGLMFNKDWTTIQNLEHFGIHCIYDCGSHKLEWMNNYPD